MKKLIKNTIKDVSIRGWLLLIILIIGCCEANAEVNVTRNGNVFTATSSRSSKSSAKQTQYSYTDTDGKTYPVYITGNGRCYIKRVSSKTGKEYNKYLPEDVSRTIAKELGIEYKEKKK